MSIDFTVCHATFNTIINYQLIYIHKNMHGTITASTKNVVVTLVSNILSESDGRMINPHDQMIDEFFIS